MEYRREIDGLRAVAVLPVILFHAGVSAVSGGFVGVDIFFVISGYLITSIIIAELRAGTFSLSQFYQRRVRRIFPALFFMMVICLPLAWRLMLPSEMRDFAKSLVSVPLFVSNYYFRQDTGYFAAAAEEKPLLHTWSLAVEEQYYFIFPALVWLLWAFGRRWMVPVLLVCFCASFGFAVWQSGIDHEILFFDSRGRFWEILAGSGIVFFNESRFRRGIGPAASQILSLVGFGMIVGCIALFDETIHFPSVYTLIPVVGAALIISFASSKTTVGKLLGNPLFVGIGLISYSAYLWHQPLLAFARLRFLGEIPTTTSVLIALLSLPIAFLSWRFIERPFRQKGAFSARFVFTGAACASVLMICLGLWGNHNNGFEGRFDGREVALHKVWKKENGQRVKLSRPGVCHFTGKHGNKKIEKFLEKWNCTEEPDNPELMKTPVIVVGDSHAADVVAAFKMNRYLPVHMAGSGCSVVPRFMSTKCRAMFDYIKDLAQQNPSYTHILLVNRASPSEATPKAISQMVEYWSIPGKQIVYLTSRPEFPKYQRALILDRKPKANFNRATLTSQPEIIEKLRESQVQVINSKDIFCSLTPNCGAHDDTGAPLTTDGHHFTRRGAELFGKRIIELGLVPVTMDAQEASTRARMTVPTSR
jgi:peptidoglycan/LPS O-acetylase OafA/YrhL